MPFIGLTGGLGMGKTTVLRLFKNSGAHVINADKLVHELLKKPAIIKKLVSRLGNHILMKRSSRVSINKKLLAEIIFNDTKKRRIVEKVIHPEVIKTAKNLKTKILRKNKKAVVVFEVPLLFEAGYGNLFDEIIVVHCSQASAIARLSKQGFSRKEVLQRMGTQNPVSKKKARADFLINNNSDIDDIKPRVKTIFKKLEIKYTQ